MKPTKVLIGSKNSVKIESTQQSFARFFKPIEVKGLPANSGVPDQPFNEDTFTGAKNRAEHAKRINDEQCLNANFFVGIEGGILQLHNRWFQQMVPIHRHLYIGSGAPRKFRHNWFV